MNGSGTKSKDPGSLQPNLLAPDAVRQRERGSLVARMLERSLVEGLGGLFSIVLR